MRHLLRFGTAMLVGLTALPAYGEALNMEYDYGLDPGELEVGLINYYTRGSAEVIGDVSSRTDYYESYLEPRLQITETWSAALSVPYLNERYSEPGYSEWSGGFGDVALTNRYAVLNDPLEGRSVIAGLTLKVPTAKQGFGTATTDLSAMLLFHQKFAVMYDLYLHLEYARAVTGRGEFPPPDKILHNAALSVHWDPRWEAVLELLGTYSLATEYFASGYRLEVAPGLTYMAVQNRFWVAASVISAAVREGATDQSYRTSFHLSGYIYFDLF